MASVEGPRSPLDSSPGQAAPGDSLGRYRLLKKLARGGMAEVYAARSFGAHGFEKTVAIKRILPRYGDDPQFVRMIVDEAKITVLLNHPNVATVVELCEQDGDYFIVMEYVPGPSLSALGKRLRERSERLSLLDACFVIVELLQGLHAAHMQHDAQGKPARIIHRDVSPQNVLLSFDGHVKVIDFGIARAKHRLELTEVGTIKGKLRYLAPEMIDPARFTRTGDFDHRVDVFAAGIVLWELVANRTLYQGDDEMVVYDAITDSDAPDLAALGLCDAALAAIVKKALARNPEARYGTAEDFADALRAYVYRTDPAFTHKRLAALLEQLFPAEKAESIALARGIVPGLPDLDSLSLEQPRKERSASARRKAAAAPQPPLIEAPPPGAFAVAPDGDTKTKTSGASGPWATGSDDRRQTANQPSATRQMRTAESTRKLPSVPPARDSPSGHNKVVVPIDADDLRHAQGDVLTTMTLVSRSGSDVGASARSGESPRRARGDGFTGAPDTITAGPTLPGGATAQHRLASGPAIVDETPHTSTRSRLSRSMEQSVAPVPRPLLFAALGSIAVLVLVAGLLAWVVSKPGDEGGKAGTDVVAAKSAVDVVVTSPTPGAIALALGRALPVPATFMARPGETVDIRVQAPGYEEWTSRVVVPEGDAPHTVNVVLQRAPVPLTLDLSPPFAVAVVGHENYRAGMPIAVGERLTIQVGAPGYVTQTKEVEAIGEPLQLRIALKPDTGGKRERDRGPTKTSATAAKATLVLRTKPVWGEVTIDGKTYDETTPLTVELRAGRHNVVVTHPPKGYRKAFTVTLKPGETETKTIAFE